VAADFDCGGPAASHFERDADGNVVGTLELPMPVGLVGGATKVHPVAQAAIKLLGVRTASELAEIILAAGLAQNFAAVRAVATEGIQRGHMSLHARNVASIVGATPVELPQVVARLIANRTVRADHCRRQGQLTADAWQLSGEQSASAARAPNVSCAIG
jgi:hydroxymethylglutaryl-CoA reductase